MELSDDPRIPELQAKLNGIKVGEPDSCTVERLKAILSDASLFGADLCEAGMAKKVRDYLREMLKGKGAVRAALHELVEKF